VSDDPALTATASPATPRDAGTDPTVAADAGLDATVAAPSASTSDPGTDATVAAAPSAGPDGTLAARLAPVVLGDVSLIAHAGSMADSGAITRTVGDELRGASIERFDEVARTRFEVLGELARGGLGRVLRARDPRTGRVVALKEVLRPTPDLLARFAREAMVTANLQHPAIVPVYEVGRWPSGEPFYAMKLVRGRALDALIAEADTTEARIALVPHAIAIAEALAYAHSERVIHRDLKPANVLIGPYGETVVIDWGLARNLGERELASAAPAPSAIDEPGATVVGAILGTPAYMPPEQAAGEPLDERADVYAIGAILYHVLAGVRPYAEQRTIEQLLRAVEDGPPRALAELAPTVPAELVTIVGKAMARAPAERYPTAEGLADDLRRFQTGQLVGAHRYSTWQRLRRWVGRHRGAVATAAVALVALAGFAGLSVSRIARERDVAERERAAAHAAQAVAEQQVGETLEELGRQALLAGEPERALPYLAAAGGRAPSRPTLALLLGQALAPFAGLRAVLPRSEVAVGSADLAADGRRAITATAGLAIAYDVATGVEAWRAPGVHQVAVSPDGTLALCVGPERAVTVRRAEDGVVVRQWTLADPARAALIAWSRDGQQVAIGTYGGVIATGRIDEATLTERQLHTGRVWTVAFAPSGDRLATVGEDGRLTVLEPRGPADGPIALVGEASIGAGWAGDRALISVDRDGAMRRWAPDDGGRWGERRALPHGPDPYGVLVDPAGAWAVTYGHGPRARLWDLRTDTLRAELVGHELAVAAAAAVGRYLVTCDERGGLRVWDPTTGTHLQSLPVEEPAPGLAVRGELLLTYGAGRPRVWQLRPDQPLRQRALHEARVRALAFDPVRPIVWSASNDGAARGLALTSDEVVALGQADYREPVVASMAEAGSVQSSPRGLRSITLTDDDRLITTREDGAVTFWDRARGQPLATWTHAGRARRVVLSRDRRRAYVIAGATLYLRDAATGAVLAEAPLGATGWDVALLAQDTVVATLDDERQTSLWDAATLAPRPGVRAFPDRLRELLVIDDRLVVASDQEVFAIDVDGKIHGRANHPAAIAVAWSGGDQLAVASSVGDLAVRRAADVALVRRWRIDDGVVALAYRPDGAVLASAGGRRVRLWDPDTGRELAASPEVPALVTQLAWSADGAMLAFGGGSGVVYVWNLAAPMGDPAAQARCFSPWRLDGSGLSAAPLDLAACAKALAP
jgi:WD40 repeat protein/tRNA A-37 threonylcarbamoyl transferase component Bud32